MYSVLMKNLHILYFITKTAFVFCLKDIHTGMDLDGDYVHNP